MGKRSYEGQSLELTMREQRSYGGQSFELTMLGQMSYGGQSSELTMWGQSKVRNLHFLLIVKTFKLCIHVADIA